MTMRRRLVIYELGASISQLLFQDPVFSFMQSRMCWLSACAEGGRDDGMRD